MMMNKKSWMLLIVCFSCFFFFILYATGVFTLSSCIKNTTIFIFDLYVDCIRSLYDIEEFLSGTPFVNWKYASGANPVNAPPWKSVLFIYAVCYSCIRLYRFLSMVRDWLNHVLILLINCLKICLERAVLEPNSLPGTLSRVCLALVVLYFFMRMYFYDDPDAFFAFRSSSWERLCGAFNSCFRCPELFETELDVRELRYYKGYPNKWTTAPEAPNDAIQYEDREERITTRKLTDKEIEEMRSREVRKVVVCLWIVLQMLKLAGSLLP